MIKTSSSIAHHERATNGLPYAEKFIQAIIQHQPQERTLAQDS